MSQRKFAGVVGVYQLAIANCKADIRELRLSELERIVEAFKVNVPESVK